MSEELTLGALDVDPEQEEEPLEMARPEQEVFPPATNPMAVARQLLPDWTEGDAPTLRSWRGTWMRWYRSHWAEVDDSEIRAALYRRLEHAVYLNAEGEHRPWSPTKRKLSDLKDALGALTLLRSPVNAPTWVDSRDHGQIVACENGLLRVSDRALMDHSPAFFNLVSVPFAYDPHAPEPKRWLEFLDQLWPDDPDSISALQEFFGYVVSGRTDLHKIFMILGPTRSGKGTIGRVLTSLIGKGNMAGPTLASLSTNFGLSPLLGKPLAIVSDARLRGGGAHEVVERLLTISGEDSIDVDRKFKEPWTGKLPTRFLILSNELPNFGDASGAIAHRFIVLTMENSWLGRENTALTDQLSEELPGILNWALDGLDRLGDQGRFTEPTASGEAVVAMKDSASPMSAFVRDWCEVGAGHEVPVDELYQAWKDWCEENGRDRPGTKQAFGRNLQAAVPRVKVHQPRDGDRRLPRVYRGIGVRPTMATTAFHRVPDAPADSVERDGTRPTPLRGQHEGRSEGASAECPSCSRPLAEPARACSARAYHGQEASL